MSSDDEFGLNDTDNWDDTAFQELDAIETAIKTGSSLPPKSIIPQNLKQRDLFGGTVAPPQPRNQPVAGPSRVNSAAGAPGGAEPKNKIVAKVKATKQWDSASFARHGWSKRRAEEKKRKDSIGKGKKRSYDDGDGWDDEEEVVEDDEDGDEEDVLLDQNYDPSIAPLPIKWEPDPETSKTWHYPVQEDKPLRTYQYNIVHGCLFENTLVSLPTGLGKTFIAACVMLNFYRWYPQGRVIFLAPTRPLVTQQIKACHYIAGIPQSEAIELTGQTAPSLRTLAWATKRVIYCTPQTLENDLAKGRIDPRDITCVVVDEAHRASGDYSYCGVVRFIMSRNIHFRVLALTATPGSKGEAVQSVIDNLHITKIEVRTDNSLDIKQYMHTKAYDLRVVPLGEQLGSIRDRWGNLMQTYLRPLNAAKLVWETNPAMLSPYSVQIANGKLKDLPGGSKANARFYPMIKTLGTMARAMEYLVVQSMTSFETILKDLEQEGPKTLTSNQTFRDLISETRMLRGQPGYVGHPKMDELSNMCFEHFQAAKGIKDERTGEPVQTRVMVFCNFRAVVGELVDCLNRMGREGGIKATTFVGQASSKGVKGKSQRDQIETIKKFKQGIYNVLVATSIGEEGLDIGEIDLIICYEANKSPIRMLQRVGRTGRARDGKIIVFMTEGREEKNWDKAKDAYADVQNALTSNKIFELYSDGDRMLPAHLKPAVDKVVITAKPLDLASMTMAGQGRNERRTTAEEKKQKKQRDPKLNMPNHAFEGFVTAGQLALASRKTPEEDMRQRRKEALLTLEEETDLKEKWQPVGPNNEEITPRPLDIYDLPFTSTSTAIKSGHSHLHDDAVRLRGLMNKLGEDAGGEAYDKWHEKSGKGFKVEAVELWDSKRTKRKREEGTAEEPREHSSLKRRPA